MSSDTMLYLTKQDKFYRLNMYQGDEKMFTSKFLTLKDALIKAREIMKEEDIEYGLRLGKL